MARSQNSFIKKQKAFEKKKKRDRKLQRKIEKKHQEKDSDIHDMENLERPVELGFLPEEKYPQNLKGRKPTPTRDMRKKGGHFGVDNQ